MVLSLRKEINEPVNPHGGTLDQGILGRAVTPNMMNNFLLKASAFRGGFSILGEHGITFQEIVNIVACGERSLPNNWKGRTTNGHQD